MKIFQNFEAQSNLITSLIPYTFYPTKTKQNCVFSFVQELTISKDWKMCINYYVQPIKMDNLTKKHDLTIGLFKNLYLYTLEL